MDDNDLAYFVRAGRAGGIVAAARDLNNVCPLKPACTRSDRGRTLSIHPQEDFHKATGQGTAVAGKISSI